MTARIVLTDEHVAALRRCLFDQADTEGAAFLLCGQSVSEDATKLFSHAVVPIAEEDFVRREWDGLSITSRALTRIAKLAHFERMSVVFAHSHPMGLNAFSLQDDQEEDRLLPFLHARVPGRAHGTLVMTETEIVGRVYAPTRLAASVLVVGERIRLFGHHDGASVPAIFDRQVRAFGPEVQSILAALHVGVVGLGGTGSPVAEQLCRLGVGTISLFDGDVLDETNVNRVYGSKLDDAGASKVDIAKRHLDEIGLPVKVQAHPHHITQECIAQRLRGCDVVFGCTDKQIPRAILTQLALKYSLPVFDMGVLIDSIVHEIRGVHGRVTTLLPGEACLYCRGRISPEAMRVEALPAHERERQVREGYAPELDAPAPAVIAFTSAVASFAVSEFLHRLTGFMGKERVSSELLIAFDLSRLRTNRVPSREDCFCSDRSVWGRGDESPFLALAWPSTHSK